MFGSVLKQAVRWSSVQGSRRRRRSFQSYVRVGPRIDCSRGVLRWVGTVTAAEPRRESAVGGVGGVVLRKLQVG